MIATKRLLAWEFGANVAEQDKLHRWYDAGVGRWISEDPIGFEAGDANLYRYVGNEVTRWVDPSGLSAGVVSATCGAGASGGILTAAAATAGGIAIVAVGASGYVVGQEIDKAGCNPITPVFVAAVDVWHWCASWSPERNNEDDIELSKKITEAQKELQKLLEEAVQKGYSDSFIEEIIQQIDENAEWLREIWGMGDEPS